MSLTPENKERLTHKRRHDILTAAKKLFFQNGFENTSMEAIAAEAGISKGLIYHYFNNKEGLLLAFTDEVNTYLSELTKRDPMTALTRFGADFLETDPKRFADIPPIQVFLITFAERQVDTQKYQDANLITSDLGRTYLAALFQRGMDAGIFKAGDAKVYGDVYWSFLLGKLLTVKKGNEHEAPAFYAKELLSLFLKKE